MKVFVIGAIDSLLIGFFVVLGPKKEVGTIGRKRLSERSIYR